jgi:mannosyltransferase
MRPPSSSGFRSMPDLLDGLRGWKHEALALGLLTLLAGGMRLYRLGDWSFWGDEIITVHRALALMESGVSRWSLSLLLENLALRGLGVNEFNARLVPAIVGTLSIPLLVGMIRTIVGRGVALTAGLLLAISTWHLYWSQNARFYVFLLLFFTLAVILFYRGLEENRISFLLAALAALGLASLERLVALFFIPVAIAYLILLVALRYERPSGLTWRNLAVFFLPGLVPAVVMIASFPAVRNPGEFLRLFGFINNSPFWIVAGTVYYIGLPVFLLGLVGSIELIRQRDRFGLLLLLGGVIPLISVVLASMFQYAANRYIFVALSSWIILAAYSIWTLLNRGWHSMPRLLLVGALAMVLAGPLVEDMLYYRYQHGNRDNWKAAFAYLEPRLLPQDVVVSGNRELARYYLSVPALGPVAIPPDDLATREERIWFVEDLNLLQKTPELHRWLQSNASLQAVFDVHVQARIYPLRIYLYDPAIR